MVLINKEQVVVQGSVQEVKRQHGRNVARLKLDHDPDAPWLDELAGVQVTKRRQDYIEMQFQGQASASEPNHVERQPTDQQGLSQT